MKKTLIKNIAISTIACSAFSTFNAIAEDIITLGTGGQTGVYYQVGQGICKLVNRQYGEELKCNAPSTGGSIDNINAIALGERDFGVVQSDWQYHAYKGTSKFEESGAIEDLRFVFSVYPEAYTIVARADSGVEKLEDIKGKRFNIGNPGSGNRATNEIIIQNMGWSMKDFAVASELKASEMSKALCDNSIDAYTYTVGNPNAAITEAIVTCNAKLIPVYLNDNDTVVKPMIDKLVEDNSYYSYVTIPAAAYEGIEEDTLTFGVGATFVSSAKVSEDVVYKLVKSIFEDKNFERFKKSHPAFAHIEIENMINSFQSIPIHKGAEKYYRERGWLK